MQVLQVALSAYGKRRKIVQRKNVLNFARWDITFRAKCFIFYSLWKHTSSNGRQSDFITSVIAVKACLMLKSAYGNVVHLVRMCSRDMASFEMDVKTCTTIHEQDVSTSGDHLRKSKPCAMHSRRTVVLRTLNKRLNTDEYTVSTIIKEDFGKRKVVACPSSLVHWASRRTRCRLCQDFLETRVNHPEFLNRIVTGGKSPLTIWKLNDKAWTRWVDRSTKCEKTLLQKSYVTTMSFRFSTPKVQFMKNSYLLHKPWLLIRTYRGQLHRRLKRIVRVRQKIGFCCTSCQNTTLIRQFLVEFQYRDPYSLDTDPADYFLFPKLKSGLKGRRFDNVATDQKSVNAGTWHRTKGGFGTRTQWYIDIRRLYIKPLNWLINDSSNTIFIFF